MKSSFFLVAVVSLLIVSCSSAVRFTSEKSASKTQEPMNTQVANQNKSDASTRSTSSGLVFRGKASYYSDKFVGKKTASGDYYSSSELTAAHKSLDFGTKVKVTNLRNNRSVIVVINDRGPFVEGRVIDLSRAAAEQIDMIRDGVVDVECEVLD